MGAADPLEPDVRVELLARFARFYGRVGIAVKNAGGDERLMKNPAQGNAPAWDATLNSSPTLIPPMFYAPLETEYRYAMSLDFLNIV